ncbi:MAG: four-helix bundle copper-binding protein [Phycisphaerales bacterium]|nr:four-helix bundle copper-binding protein [Phycisphaerales bacterium]
MACMRLCLECYKVCVETMVHCAHLGGEHAARAHQNLLHDCSDICHCSASFLARASPEHRLTCGVCARVCAACARECAAMAGGDVVMTRCAEVCLRCAESCDRMAG